ncbi:MAG: polysulfide reductase NrfD [Thermoanaerobaculia bacterium]|nr:polysulfide reductase NrfD [Thermoanaerobaculia bacterium]
MTEVEIFRNSASIDPQLHIWGWEIPVYLFLGGLTAGIMILTAIAGRRVPRESQSRAMRLMPFAAPLLLSLGMGALFLDLEYKLHVFRFYTAMKPTSPMSWGSWILLLIYPATILLGAARLTDADVSTLPLLRSLRGRAADALARLRATGSASVGALEAANVLLAVALGGYTGILLGTLGARALWSSVLLGPLFLVSGLSTGAAFMMLFRLDHGEHATLRRWDIAAIAVEFVLLGFFFVELAANGGQRGRAAAALFFGGGYTAVFWALVVITGLVTPLAMEVAEARKGLRPAILAPVLLLVGGLSLRWILVLAGQAAI